MSERCCAPDDPVLRHMGSTRASAFGEEAAQNARARAAYRDARVLL